MQIVAIIRGKSGATAVQRLEKLLKRQLFQKVINRQESVMQRITVIDAELCSAGCGVKAEDFSKLSGYDAKAC